MASKPRIFLDTSALFAAVLSEEGGARTILRLGEVKMVSLWVGPRVLLETDDVVQAKFPHTRARLAFLLDISNIQIGPSPDKGLLEQTCSLISYAADAHVLAEVLAAKAEYFVTLDRKHFLGNETLQEARLFLLGTPGDFLSWYRGKLKPK